MTYSVRLSAASGNGRLVRRADALLFVPEPAGGHALVDAFLAAAPADLDEVLAEHVLTRNHDAPGFVAVMWPIGSSNERLKIVVRGAAAVSSDIASLPELSGAGSPTWVEHRVVRNPPSASIHSGAPADAHTDFRSGIISAGGFHLSLESAATEPEPTSHTAPTTQPSPTATAPAPAHHADAALDDDDPEVTIPAPDASNPPDSTGPRVTIADVLGTTAEPEPAAPPEPAPEPPSEPEPAHDPLAALEAAAGTDWMDESLQLDATPPVPTPARTESAASPLDSDQPVPTAAPAPAPVAHGPPTFPGDDAPAPSVPVSAPAPNPPLDRVVSARICPNGHPNSPHDLHCRLCATPLDLDRETVTVEQPTLAIIRLPDGTAVPVSGDIVVGRNPSAAAARLDGATLIPLQAPSSVSRTHLSVAVDGWRLLVTDCGSRAGSAIVIDGEDDPIALEAWMPHEINGGDRLFLGGPTELAIHEVPSS